MRALTVVRNAPTAAAVRLHTMQAEGDRGMATAEYAVATVVEQRHASRRRRGQRK